MTTAGRYCQTSNVTCVLILTLNIDCSQIMSVVSVDKNSIRNYTKIENNSVGETLQECQPMNQSTNLEQTFLGKIIIYH